MTRALAQRLGGRLRLDEGLDCDGLPEQVCEDVPANTVRMVGALTLQRIGDVVVDARTVLPWVLAAVGAPAGLTGLLVPIRESGSMLPQAVLAGRVRRAAVRKWVWVAGAAGQFVAVGGMALAVATSSGVLAGLSIIAALTAFALARSLSSIASKDVLGRTIPKGRRGRVNGWATLMAGVVAVTVGLTIRLFGGDDIGAGAYAVLLAAASLVWLAAAAAFATVTEPPGDRDQSKRDGWLAPARALLRSDGAFRRFVAARGLMLVSALSPPFVVALAAQHTDSRFSELGLFVVASGVAAMLGGRFFGGLADHSSRLAMMIGAGGSSVVVLALLAMLALASTPHGAWVFVTAYLLLALAHTGARVGRKTLVVDLATGNRRTDYVAVSNTVMGIVLLATGAVSAALAQLGVEIALLFLASLGLVGVLVTRSIPQPDTGSEPEPRTQR